MPKTAEIKPLFEPITFTRLPAGMERSGKKERSTYDWGSLSAKDGIKVPGDKYLSASGSATTFAKNYPHDDKQQAAIAKHLSGRVLAARNEAIKNGTEWTDDMEKAVQPDPEFVEKNTRAFATAAVRDDNGVIIRSDPKAKLADHYYIIRVR